jgi:AcrR family transcriptional regulator
MPLPSSPPSRPASRRKKRSAPAAYHHGNLREALLQAGLELLRDHGADALGLRELARQAGVSRTAPYRHFENREALIAAIAEQGFLRLQAYLDQARETGAGDIERWFLEAGRQYIRFAADNPEHLKVMFGPYVNYEPDLHARLHAVGEATFGRLVEMVVFAQQAGLVRAGDPVNVSLSVWSLVHGFSMLLVHKRLDFLDLDPKRIAALAEQATHDALAAVRASAPAKSRRRR